MKTADDDLEEQFYRHLHQILPYHQVLLRDETRNLLFYEAIRRNVTNETRVLDIGAGSGVWAITAAKLGAKKVTAIETDEVMLPVIAAHARENGVADRVEIVNGNSLEIDLKHKYDLIISETIGNQAFDENIVNIMIDARKRFLARGGKVIPHKVALTAAPAHLGSETETPMGVPISTNYIKNLAFNFSSKIINKDEIQFLAEPVKLLEVDLRKVTSAVPLQGMAGTWHMKNVSKANVVALWAECELDDGIVLDTWNTINWHPVVCRFRPIDLKKGNLEFTLNIDDRLYHWAVRAPDAPGGASQSYTPMFAYTKIKLDSKNIPRKKKLRKRSPGEDQNVL